MKILIIEDDLSMQEIIQRALNKERFVTEIAGDFNKAMDKVTDYTYDCILLDIMLPGGSGLELLKALKELQKEEKVIIISAKDSIDDKVKGLEYGADDYLTKPFHIAELIARVRSVLRRNSSKGSAMLSLGNITIDTQNFQAKVGDKPIELKRKEYDILQYFVQRPNYLIDKSVLAEAVWGDNIDQVDNFDFIYAQLKNLRKKLTEADADAEIKVVYGLGYKMVLK